MSGTFLDIFNQNCSASIIVRVVCCFSTIESQIQREIRSFAQISTLIKAGDGLGDTEGFLTLMLLLLGVFFLIYSCMDFCNSALSLVFLSFAFSFSNAFLTSLSYMTFDTISSVFFVTLTSRKFVSFSND